jgi:hypothetical protein
MTIDEETDLDLKEFESSEDDKGKIHSGYKSAPEAGGDRKKPYAFIQSESTPAAGERGYIVPRSEHLGSSDSLDSSAIQELVDTSTSQTVASQDESADTYKKNSYHSDGSVFRERKLKDVDEGEGSSLCFRRSRSMSLPRKRKGASVHPLVSISTSPNAQEDRKGIPWREERLFKGGIHSESSHIVSDSETSGEEKYMSEVSARSSMSRRARKARIRRLQSESSTKRHRSRTLDPPKIRRRYDRQSTYDSVPESHNATLNRLLFGSEHSAEEASL